MSYLREARLRVVSAFDALDLSELHFSFETHQNDLQTPNTASIRIWNVAAGTANKVQDEGARVILEAGYEDEGVATIFDGSLVQVRRGRANATDTFLDLYVADGDAAYSLATVNASFPAGSSNQERFNALVEAFRAFGVVSVEGDVPVTNPLARGKVLFGMAREQMRQLVEPLGYRWSIQNGVLVVIPDDGARGGEAVVLRPDTGLIGVPEQTFGGVNVRALINPALRIGGLVQLSAKVNEAAISLAYTGVKENPLLPSLNSDGIYRVIVMEHRGDTRGQNWYSDLICVSQGMAPPAALTPRIQ